MTDYNADFAANDETNLRAERALSAFEQRHKVVVAGVFESPWKGVAGSNLAERLFSGFTISPVFRANSSRPFNLLVGADINNDRHPTTDRPPGAGRNSGIGPNFCTFDLRLTRQFGLGEERNLQFSAVSAARAFIDVTAECNRTTACDGQQDLNMGPTEPLTVALEERCSCGTD